MSGTLREELAWPLLEQMLLIRRFEEAVLRLSERQAVHRPLSPLHRSGGDRRRRSYRCSNRATASPRRTATTVTCWRAAPIPVAPWRRSLGRACRSLRRARRHHPSQRSRPRLHLDLRHRRRLHLARGWRGLCVPPARRGRDLRRVLRRRRPGGRHQLRGAQHCLAVAPAGPVCLREQQHRLMGARPGLSDARAREQRSLQHRKVGQHHDHAGRWSRRLRRTRRRGRGHRAVSRRQGPGLP